MPTPIKGPWDNAVGGRTVDEVLSEYNAKERKSIVINAIIFIFVMGIILGLFFICTPIVANLTRPVICSLLHCP